MEALNIETRPTVPGLSVTSPDRLQGFYDLAKPRPPRLLFEKAEKYIADYKEVSHNLNPFSRKDLPSLPHEEYLNDLNKRDHVRNFPFSFTRTNITLRFS
jgi:hypothetical protein